MYKKIFNRGNAYFDTYHIYDSEHQNYIGVIEHHCRHVLHEYWVGIKFKDRKFFPDTFQTGESHPFCSYQDAFDYIK